MTATPEPRVLLDLSEKQADVIIAALTREVEALTEAGPEYAQDKIFVEELITIVDAANPCYDDEGNIIPDWQTIPIGL